MPELDGASTYFARAMERLQTLARVEMPQIRRAARMCADSIRQGGLVFLFGSGHSRFLCDEMAPRQGCFVGFVPLAHTALSTYADVVGPNGLRPTLFLERYEGYAERVLNGYQFGPTRHNDRYLYQRNTAGCGGDGSECEAPRPASHRDPLSRTLPASGIGALFWDKAD